MDSLTLGVPYMYVYDDVVNNMLATLKSASQAEGGLYLRGATTITLLSDGTMSVTNTVKGWTNQIVPLPSNKALFVDGTATLYISGYLKGQLTIGGGPGIQVYITDNIRYVDDPRIIPTSTDMIAFVMQGAISVANSAPYNLEIDAYMFTKSQFTAQAGGAAKGTLTIYGGMEIHAPAWYNIYTPVTSSLSAQYENCVLYYDTRLESTIPPYFSSMIPKDSNNRSMYLKTQGSWYEL